MKKLLAFFFLVAFLSPQLKAKEERILFSLKFGFIKGGEAELIITDTLFQDKKALHYYLEGRTTGLTDKLFGVNDVYESTVDAQTHLPLKSIRNIKEGRYRWYNETLYFQEADSIFSEKSGGRSAPPNLVDIVSVFFYFINNHLMEGMEKGTEVTLPTFHADKIQDVSVKYVGDHKVKTDLGVVDCYVLAPT